MYGMGIIGLGVMGRRMANAVAAHRAFRVAAGYDPCAPADCRGIAMKPAAAAVISDPAVDCVYIASPPATHADLVAAVAAARKPLICEKPLTASVAEAHMCVEAVRDAGIPAAVNFPFATATAAVRLLELVRQGELGAIRSAALTLRFAQWPRGWHAAAGAWLSGSAEGGFTREVGSHFLFLAQRLFGPGTVRAARTARGSNGAETALVATIDYKDVALTIDAAVAGEAEDYNRFEVRGTRDTAAVTDWYRLDHAGTLSERRIPIPDQLDALARLLGGETNHGLATFEEAAAIVELVETLLATRSAAGRQELSGSEA